MSNLVSMSLWGVFALATMVHSFEFGLDEYFLNGSEFSHFDSVYGVSAAANPYLLMVPLTLIPGAAAKGAVCLELDGTLPGYHFHRGYGSGANSWLVELEGGGWCNSIRACVYRKKTRRGSSSYMEKELAFTGILSNKAEA